MAKYGVRKRGSRWIARPYVPGRGHIYVRGSFDSEAEATKAALDLIDERRRLPAHRETVSSFAARWVHDFPRPKQSTMDRYHSDARRFAAQYGSKRLHEITVPEARSYALSHPHDLGALRAMLSDARRDGLVTANPFAELGIKKGRGRRDICVVTAEELCKLADLATAVHPDYPTFRAMLLFAAHSGLRTAEVCGLDWPDIDFAAEEISVLRQYHKRRETLPKNGRTRKVFLSPPAAEALKAMPRRIDNGILFRGKLGQRITASALSNYWAPVRSAFRATLEPGRLAEFDRVDGALDFYSVTRHYCATSLVEQGVESWIVARQLGHEDGGRLVERVYGHPRDEVARERLRRAFGENVAPIRAVEDSEAASG